MGGTKMTELDYLDPKLLDFATTTLEKGGSLSIRVPAKLSARVKNALVLHHKYFSLRKKGKRDRLVLMKFGWHAMRTPTLWVVLNKAEILGIEIATYERDGDLLIVVGAQAPDGIK